MEGTVIVLEKTLNIIEYLSQNNAPVSLSQISKDTSISKTTVHRLLQTLLARHYVEKNELQQYSIGWKLIQLVSNQINHLELQTEANPILSNLREELRLSVHLGILDGQEVVYIERMQFSSWSGDYLNVGYRSPAHCSSMGKCLLSCMSGHQLDAFLDNCRFEKYTENTITNANDFRKYLKKVRQQGWAMDNEEYLTGHRCIGVPVYDYRGEAIASISASGSHIELSDERIEFVVEQVKDAAGQISKRMGYPSN